MEQEVIIVKGVSYAVKRYKNGNLSLRPLKEMKDPRGDLALFSVEELKEELVSRTDHNGIIIGKEQDFFDNTDAEILVKSVMDRMETE